MLVFTFHERLFHTGSAPPKEVMSSTVIIVSRQDLFHSLRDIGIHRSYYNEMQRKNQRNMTMEMTLQGVTNIPDDPIAGVGAMLSQFGAHLLTDEFRDMYKEGSPAYLDASRNFEHRPLRLVTPGDE